MAKEDEVRLIAYNIWTEEGCPEGHDCDHWYRAEFIWEQQQKPKVVKEEVKAVKVPVKVPPKRKKK